MYSVAMNLYIIYKNTRLEHFILCNIGKPYNIEYGILQNEKSLTVKLTVNFTKSTTEIWKRKFWFIDYLLFYHSDISK